MLRRLATCALASLLALAWAVPARAGVGDEILVARDGGLTRGERAAAGVDPARRSPVDGVQVVEAGADRGEALAALRADPDVRWAEPNRVRRIAADPLAGALWGLQNTGQSVWWRRGTPDADIDAPEAWALGQGAGVTVAVVDTGADLAHPDLAGRLVPGWDFAGRDAAPQDEHGHGTHVAGTVAAGDNGVGVVGVSPQAGVMPLRVLDGTGAGSTADVAAAFAYAGDHGARVVNASLGSPYQSLAERAAIRAHPDTLYVVAAGNGGADGVGDDNDGTSSQFPCALDEPNVLCVAASDPDDARAPFSNYGASSVDVFAPGVNVVSVYPAGRDTQLNRYFGTGPGYEVMQGTSMATPHAAGAAAIVAGLRPDWTGAQVKAAILAGADRVAALRGLGVTGGRLNAAAAARAAAAGSAVAAPRSVPALFPAGSQAAPGTPAGTGAEAGTATPAARARPSALRLHGSPRTCRRTGCSARAARLTFRLPTAATVSVRLAHRACAGGRCTWRPAGTRTRGVGAGRTAWPVGPSLLGMALSPGRWRVTVATEAGAVRRAFRVG